MIIFGEMGRVGKGIKNIDKQFKRGDNWNGMHVIPNRNIRYSSGSNNFWDILQKILRNYYFECISELE